MDERRIKRLMVLIAISLIAIFAAKYMITDTFTKLGKASGNKKPVATLPVKTGEDTATSGVPGAPASAVDESGTAPSASSETDAAADPAPELR